MQKGRQQCYLIKKSMCEYICSFPFKIPAENDGCPDGEFCRPDGCSDKQCDTNEDCGGSLPFCNLNTFTCEAPCPIVFVEPTVPTPDTVINVPSDSIQTIQAAINAADASKFTRINVAAGTYAAFFTVNKPILLKGAGVENTIITCDSTNKREVISLIGANGAIEIDGFVVIEGFTFRADESCLSGDKDLIELRAASTDGNNIIIRGNKFLSNGLAGVKGVEESLGTGSTLSGTKNWIIYNNDFVAVSYSLFVNNGLNGKFIGNRMSSSRVGIGGSGTTGPKDQIMQNNVFVDPASFAFLISSNVETASFQCNVIADTTEAAFVNWQGTTAKPFPKNWDDININFNDILKTNADGFKVFSDGEYGPGALPGATDGMNNYWGSDDGPGLPQGEGNGTPLSVTNFMFEPFLVSPLFDES